MRTAPSPVPSTASHLCVSAGGVVWRIRASDTRLVCAAGSRNGTEETKLLVLNFDLEDRTEGTEGTDSWDLSHPLPGLEEKHELPGCWTNQDVPTKPTHLKSV